MDLPIVDFHCDLLFYLGLNSRRTPYDEAARCSIPQLRRGNVKLQMLAVFTETGPGSLEKGHKQVNLFQSLPLHCPKDIAHYSSKSEDSPQIGILLAFENASGFCSEEEPLQEGLNRLRKIVKENAKPLYVSLTWNSENRFGGGALTKVGLKEDGKRLLDELHQLQIAVDFSHTSDALAYDIFDYVEGEGLHLPVLASHSNARAIRDVPRNLPDELAKEIFKRGGIIGMNFIRDFIGESEENFLRHFEHWLGLGGENHMVLGGDFFNDADLPPTNRCTGKGAFFDAYPDASCYGTFLSFLQRELRLSTAFMDKLSHQNALAFITP